MRVLLIHNYYRYWGGEDTYFETLKKLLEENGHQVIPYVKNSKEVVTLFDKFKVFVSSFWNMTTERELARLLKDTKPDLAQVQNFYPRISPSVYSALKNSGVPIVQRVSNYKFIAWGGYYGWKLTNFLLSLVMFLHKIAGTFKKIDFFLFPSEIIKNDYVKKWKLTNERTVVIPTFTHELISKLKIRDKKYFLYIGRLSEEKGILDLLKAFKELPKIKLIIIGSGPLDKKIEEYNRYENITYKGYLPKERLTPYYRDAIATIVPSIVNDVMPNVVLESFYNKTPVIAPSKEIFNELIQPKHNGLHYPAGDIGGLKNSIVYAYNNKAMMGRMGKNAKHVYDVRYSKKIVYNRLISFYKEVSKK